MATRSRYFMTCVYPENLPDDWRHLMDSVIVPWVESPLHDADLFDDRTDYDARRQGEYKKPHIHIIVHFDDVKSTKQLAEEYYPFLKPANNGVFIPIANPRSYHRYLWHDPQSFPDKHPYLQSDVVYHCGARPEDFEALSASECNDVYSQIIKWIDANNVREIATVQRFAFGNKIDDWIFVLNRKSMLLYQYLASVRNLAGESEKITFNEKGEWIQDDGT